MVCLTMTVKGSPTNGSVSTYLVFVLLHVCHSPGPRGLCTDNPHSPFSVPLLCCISLRLFIRASATCPVTLPQRPKAGLCTLFPTSHPFLAHYWLKFYRNTLTGYTDDRRCSSALVRETLSLCQMAQLKEIGLQSCS